MTIFLSPVLSYLQTRWALRKALQNISPKTSQKAWTSWIPLLYLIWALGLKPPRPILITTTKCPLVSLQEVRMMSTILKIGRATRLLIIITKTHGSSSPWCQISLSTSRDHSWISPTTGQAKRGLSSTPQTRRKERCSRSTLKPFCQARRKEPPSWSKIFPISMIKNDSARSLMSLV